MKKNNDCFANFIKSAEKLYNEGNPPVNSDYIQSSADEAGVQIY